MKKYGKDKGLAEPFVGLSWNMIDSPAWKCLSPAAIWVYVHMKRRWHSGRLTLPFSDVRWKMKWPAFDRARKELLDLGFIVILEYHGLDGLATVYGTSERWKERSRELMRGREAGRVIRRVRRVNGEAQIVPAWEPIKPQSDRRAATQRANLKRADAANPKKGVRTSDEITSTQRTSPKKNPSQSPDKHVIGFPNLGNGNPVSPIPNLGNGNADSHSQFGKRAIPNLGNDNTTPAPVGRRGRPRVRPVPVTAPPSEESASASLRIPPMAIIEEAQVRHDQGKTISELKAWIEQQGYDPARVRWSSFS